MPLATMIERADQHAQAGRSGPDQPVEQHAPRQRRVFQRRDDRRRREAERFRDEVLTERAGESECLRSTASDPMHRHPAQARNEPADDRQKNSDQNTVAAPLSVRVRMRIVIALSAYRSPRPSAASPPIVTRPAPLGFSTMITPTRPTQHREPLSPADVLAEHRHRQRRDQQRRRHEDRVRVRRATAGSRRRRSTTAVATLRKPRMTCRRQRLGSRSRQ